MEGVRDNEWAVSEGQLDYSDTLEMTMSQAKKLGLLGDDE